MKALKLKWLNVINTSILSAVVGSTEVVMFASLLIREMQRKIATFSTSLRPKMKPRREW